MWWQIAFLILAIVLYLLLPQPKVEQPAVQQMDSPKASAGSPVIVVFGTMLVEELNVMWFGDKEFNEREVPVEKK